MTIRPATLRLALVAAAVALAAAPACAQEMRGVTLGDLIPEGLIPPLGTEVAHPYAYTLWSFVDGLAMSATSDAETGTVLYLELWRPERRGTAQSPIRGLTYGVSTRADIAAMFGSEGIVFGSRGRVADLGPIAAHFTSYEIAGSGNVVSFVTIQPIGEAAPETADAAVLDSVILGNGAYLDQIWGANRGYLPNSVPVPDPFRAD